MFDKKKTEQFSVINNLIKATKNSWDKFIQHPFGHKMVSNQISVKNFAYYLHQDAFYLITYLDALYLLRSKARNELESNFVIKIINFVEAESDMNKDMVKTIREHQVDSEPKSTICFAYSAWFYQIAHQYDFLGLLIALTPCPVGYYFFGKYWKSKINAATETIFKKWINYYITAETEKLIFAFYEFLEHYKGIENNQQYYQQLITIFKQAILFEIDFFNQDFHEST